MKTLIAVALAALMSAQPVEAGKADKYRLAVIDTFADFQRVCLKYAESSNNPLQDDLDRFNCASYAVAVSAGIGAADVIHLAYAVAEHREPRDVYCGPPRLTARDVIKATAKLAEIEPEWDKRPASLAILRALRLEYPCK
jgi:hypothetical protein